MTNPSPNQENGSNPQTFAPRVLEELVRQAERAGASDVHLQIGTLHPIEADRSRCPFSGAIRRSRPQSSGALKLLGAKVAKWSAIGALALMGALGLEHSSRAATPPPFTDDSWTSLGGFPGALQNDGFIAASATDSSGNLYVGGRFLLIGDTLATNVAKWDGSRWSALGTGLHDPLSSQCVLALATDDSGNLYAGGDFTNASGVHANSIARWDGTSWSPLGNGVNGVVFSLAFDNGVLYAGGAFTEAGGVQATNVAQWNGTSWSALGTGMQGDGGVPVYALAVRAGELYAAGSFTKAGEQEANRIAKWDGSNWSPLGQGLDNAALALAASGNDLYVGGLFTNAGGIRVNQIARWDGSSWSALGDDMALETTIPPAAVAALNVVNGRLYAGGWFTSVGGVSAVNVAQWDGSSWSAVGNGLLRLASFWGISVRTIAAFGDKLLAGGCFGQIEPKPLSLVAWWNGDEWLPVGDGVMSLVNRLAVSPRALYVSILTYNSISTSVGIDAVQTSFIMRRDGTNWTDSGVMIQGGIYDMLASGSDLYIGGAFTNTGNLLATNLAKWDGTNWTSLGGGTDGTVFSLADDSSGHLYAAGFFSKAGGHDARGFACWDGGSWSEVGGGVDGEAYTVAIADDLIFVGGSFSEIGGIPANTVARWDGRQWLNFGQGFDRPVLGLRVCDDTVYAAGAFTTAGGVPARGLARWDGVKWSALGQGVTHGFNDMTLDGAGNLYVAGPAFILRWDGSEWSDISSGVNHEVSAIRAFTFIM